MPNVPVSVWEQISVVIVFAFLLAGLGWVLVRLFTQAIADVNAHYARLIKDTNQQWQQYIDARAESSGLLNQQMLERMDGVSVLLSSLKIEFQTHDRLEQQALGQLLTRGARTLRKDK